MMTEAEYWRDYALTRGDVETAIYSFYANIEIHQFASEDLTIHRALDKSAEFWNYQVYALQTAYFIALGRIFDNGRDTHSIHHLLSATVEHPEFFSKEAFAARRIREAGQEKPDYLDEYMKGVWAPTASDLRAIKNMLKPYTVKYKRVYRDMRIQVFAHKIATKLETNRLFSKTLTNDIEEILYGLRDITEILWQLYRNGRRPEERTGKYDYNERIRSATRGVLRSLVTGPEEGPAER
jgi:hypothetical protein